MTNFIRLISSLMTVVLWQGCGPRANESSSPSVVDIPQTAVRYQIAGDCGLQAAASWVESLHLQATGERISISDIYWWWWLLYDSFLDEEGWFLNPGVDTSMSGIQKMNLNWAPHAKVIYEHGLMLTGDFIPGEASPEAAEKIVAAENKILQQKKPGGTLSTSDKRTPQNVRRQLDDAFGVRMIDLEAKALKANEFVIGKTADGGLEYLSSLVDGTQRVWAPVVYPMVLGKGSIPTLQMTQQRDTILRRVMRALNNRQPVMMEVSASISAIDKTDATFRADLVRGKDLREDSGAHMVLITDYAVDNVPGIGAVGEGEFPDEIRQKAALFGRLNHFKAKNSWGTNRPRLGTIDGYHRFERAYLDDSLQLGFCTARGEKYCSSLLGFILPSENKEN